MSIATKLQALQTDITNARTAITNKGGTVTSGGGSSQLATDIATIPTGGNDRVIYSYVSDFTSSKATNIIVLEENLTAVTHNTSLTFQTGDLVLVELTSGYAENLDPTSLGTSKDRFVIGCRVSPDGQLYLNGSVSTLDLNGYVSFTGGTFDIAITLSGSTLTITPSNGLNISYSYATAARVNVRSITVVRL